MLLNDVFSLNGVRNLTNPNKRAKLRMPTDGQQASASGGATDRITQLKPPAQLDFDVTNLGDSWKRWKQELELYMDLAMCGKEEATKVKLFLYLIGSQGREIYDTMAFEAPASERSLSQVLVAFDTHCNPKKNETVERLKGSILLLKSGTGRITRKVGHRFEAVSDDL